ncbi:MAG: TolC family protein [Flavobacteriales bacterium]
MEQLKSQAAMRSNANKLLNLAILAVLIPIASSLYGQSENDSTLTVSEYIRLVHQYHPLIRKAELQTSKGQATVLSARGSFDPKLFGSADQKIFQDVDYYRHLTGGIQFPTRLGVKAEGFYKQANGNYLNPELTLPTEGLFGASVYVPIGEGLLFDEARLQWKRANIWNNASEAQRKSMVNQVLFEAVIAYWDWFEAYHLFELYANAAETALERQQWVVQKATIGERPFIDTLESSTQVYQRQIKANEALMKLQTSTLKLSTFLWVDDSTVLYVNPQTQPQKPEDAAEFAAKAPESIPDIQTLISNHPDQQLALAKVDLKSADLRWKKEQLKPDLNLKYSKLINGQNTDYALGNDHMIGLEVGMPMLMRKERGELRLAQLELREYELDAQQKGQQIKVYVQSSMAERQRLNNQVQLTRTSSLAFSTLMNAEKELFELGESSLFLLNRRELNSLQASGEYYQSIASLGKSTAKLYYSMGVMEEAML